MTADPIAAGGAVRGGVGRRGAGGVRVQHAPAVTAPEALAGHARWVFGTMLALLCFGLVMVYSADVVPHMRAGEDLDFLRRQLVRLGAAVGGFLLASRVRPRHLYSLARPLWGLGVFLLVLVLLVGDEVNGARRWISLGSFVFQPSEFARVATILAIGAWMASIGERTRRMRDGVLLPFGLALVPALLVLVEPDFGSSVYLIFMAVLVLWVGGARSLHLLGGFLVSLGGAALYAWTRMGHFTRRIDEWLAPAAGGQVEQGLVALGAGGLTGRGLGASVAKLGFLPEAESDFVLGVIGEELGLLGVLVLLLLYGLFLWHGTKLLLGLRSRFSLVVGAGLLMQVLVQALANVAVVTALVPPKGVPLPFVSAGGSSRLILCISTGLLLGLARRPEEDPVGHARRASPTHREGRPDPAAERKS